VAEKKQIGVGKLMFEELSCHVYGSNTGTAAHTGEVEVLYGALHLVFIDDHGSDGRGGVEETARGNDDVDVVGFEPCPLEKLINTTGEDL
jgi:hypothetical protein